MRLLFIREMGRAVARRGGGIWRSGVSIDKALSSRGWDVLSHRHQEIPDELPSADVAWFYAGDYSRVDEWVRKCLNANIPVLVNSSYIPTRNRAHHILDWWQSWGSDPRVFFGVWSHSARFDPNLVSIRNQLIMVPKTTRAQETPAKPLEGRRGFAFGDLVKMQMSDLIKDFDVERALALIHERWPEEPLYFFEQHKSEKPAFTYARVLPYQKDLLGWLSYRKAFVSLVVGETYAMVPIEAQSVGTPALYRHMPQSLTETIGQTGLLYESEEELVYMLDFLLSDSETWEAYSEAGWLNAQAHTLYSPGIDLALHIVKRKANAVTRD